MTNLLYSSHAADSKTVVYETPTEGDSWIITLAEPRAATQNHSQRPVAQGVGKVVFQGLTTVRDSEPRRANGYDGALQAPNHVWADGEVR